MLNQSYEKMKEILGESTALMFFSLASEFPAWSELGTGDLDLIGGKLSARLEAFGYSPQQTQKGNQVEYRLTCPHAHDIHPELGKNASFCPMSHMVLGTLRQQRRKSTLKKSQLLEDGSAFTIEIQEDTE